MIGEEQNGKEEEEGVGKEKPAIEEDIKKDDQEIGKKRRKKEE